MSPIQFKKARESESQAPSIIYDKPYIPKLRVDINETSSVISTALAILFHNNDKDTEATESEIKPQLKVKVVTGGITNALFCITGFSEYLDFDAVLVRVFGAEGMIDRDVETSTFASLSEAGIAPSYLGRFGNGRVEGWLDGFRPLSLSDLQDEDTGRAIAVRMAKLHFGFCVPSELRQWHNEDEPGLWGQLFGWMDQAQQIMSYKTVGDDKRAENSLDLPKLKRELDWLKDEVISKTSKVAFCHNDTLAANIMKHQDTGTIQLIDFEYGGSNFIAFDIANHFNEYAGGTTEEDNGVPDYTLLPTPERQEGFITAYVGAARQARKVESESISEEMEIEILSKEVQGFILANHLYWGLWAVNQASAEGTEDFDYMTYAINRFTQYFVIKNEFTQG